MYIWGIKYLNIANNWRKYDKTYVIRHNKR
jgi:hypothetical protein